MCVRETHNQAAVGRHACSVPRVLSAAVGPITACLSTYEHAGVLFRGGVNENHLCMLMAAAAAGFLGTVRD